MLDLIKGTSKEFRHLVVCLEREGELGCRLRGAQLVSLELGPGLQFGAVARIAGLARTCRASLIHTHNEKAQFYGALAGLMAGLPVLHSKHGRNSLDIRSRIRNYVAALPCARIVAVSRDAALQCIRDERIAAGKVVTILNGIDTDAFSPPPDKALAKRAAGLSPDLPVVGVVARLAAVKDHSTLLEACSLLRESEDDFRVLIVGDGHLRPSLEDQARCLGLAGCVTFTGARSDIPKLMRAMDVFVLPSLSEGISLTLIEAMACEVPVVATEVGGNPEVVRDGETGFLVPVRDPAFMAMRIRSLLRNVNLRREFGRQGRWRAEGAFSLTRACTEYTALYRQLAGGGRKKSAAGVAMVAEAADGETS